MKKDITIIELRKMLLDDYNELGGGWRGVGKRWGVDHAVVYRIATQGYEPRSPKIRKQLGLAIMQPAPVCLKCGVVHVTKRCPSTRENHRDLLSTPVNVIKWKLDHREEFANVVQDVSQQE